MFESLVKAAPLISSAVSLIGGASRNKAAQAASARQMAFQEDMSNTSYQRGMEDMRKAGLNPILAGKLGGASTPTGSTYNPENVATNAVNSYLQAKQNEANVKLTEAQTAKVNAETGVIQDTDGSFIGRNIEYGLKKIKDAYDGISKSEAVKTITKEYERIFANSARDFNDIKNIINQKANQVFDNLLGIGVRIGNKNYGIRYGKIGKNQK